MRRALLIAAMLFVPGQASAQSLEWANKMFLNSGGTTSHDFGSVPRGALLSHKFKMTNIWAVPIELIDIRSSCGCVKPTPSKKKLMPRETAELVVTMDAGRFTGPKSVKIYVIIGPEYTSTATLSVSANARADVVFNPGQVSFGVVNAGQSATQSIDVEYAGQLNWRILDVIKGDAPLEVKVQQLAQQRQGQVGYRLDVALSKDAKPGNHRWELNLKTNDPATPLVPVLVEANIRGALSVVPATVSLGNFSPGQEINRKVIVRGAKPFRIESVSGISDDLKVDFPTTESAVQVISIKCQPGALGDFRRQLDIRTSHEGGSSVSVTIVGTVTP